MSELLRKGLISSIESYTIHDGPGCRTTVFFAGCPLQCEWCANPETWELRQKLMYYKGKCQYDRGCRRCIEKTSCGGLLEKNGHMVIGWEKCRSCKDIACADYCKHESLKRCGTFYSVPELMKVLERDRPFWDEEGGVSFSGGEPFFQHEFFKDILQSCKEEYIHTAVETTAFVKSEVFLDIIPLLDFIFIDVKHMNPVRHREKTHVTNGQILKNIRLLAAKAAEHSWTGRVVLRVPIIEDFNDNEENMTAMAQFMSQIGLYEVNLLPFHNLGASKWKQLGREYIYEESEATQTEKLKELQSIFQSYDRICYLGSDTAF